MILAGCKHSNEDTLVLMPIKAIKLLITAFKFQFLVPIYTLSLVCLYLKPIIFICCIITCSSAFPFTVTLKVTWISSHFSYRGFWSQKCINLLLTLLCNLYLCSLTRADFCPWGIYFWHFHWKVFFFFAHHFTGGEECKWQKLKVYQEGTNRMKKVKVED